MSRRKDLGVGQPSERARQGSSPAPLAHEQGSTKEHPILCSPVEVRALLADRKHVTRKLDKQWLKVKAGDRLWVRCNFMRAVSSDGTVVSIWDEFTRQHRFSNGALDVAASREMLGPEWSGKPSIRMPRWASRILLECEEDARLERLQDITEDEVWAEGAISHVARLTWNKVHRGGAERSKNARHIFSKIWDSLHTKPGERWADNPEVVRIGRFRRAESSL